MKKYKLIKKYPGSPSLGTIATQSSNKESIEFKSTKGELKFDSSYAKDYFKKMVSSQPEFWEEVVEKDYEILSFIVTKNNEINYAKLDNNNLFQGRYIIDCTLEYMLKNFRIHSVKRLRDGLVFTVGDKIKSSIALTISSFIIIDNKLLINPSEIFGTIALSRITKIKKPLFTTEDGVDIYEGDEYFELALTFKPQFREAIYECTGRPNINYNYNTLEGKKKLNEVGRYYFSKREAAEEYTLMNNPCLSINEVMSITYNPTETFTSTSNKLKELVKSKLNESKD